MTLLHVTQFHSNNYKKSEEDVIRFTMCFCIYFLMVRKVFKYKTSTMLVLSDPFIKFEKNNIFPEEELYFFFLFET